jgi:hypothetical protein
VKQLHDASISLTSADSLQDNLMNASRLINSKLQTEEAAHSVSGVVFNETLSRIFYQLLLLTLVKMYSKLTVRCNNTNPRDYNLDVRRVVTASLMPGLLDSFWLIIDSSWTIK